MQIRNYEKWTAIALMLAIGVVHLIEAPAQFGDATYKGVWFLANAGGAFAAALAIWRGLRWGWLLGAVLAAATVAGYVWSRTVGLPGLPVDLDIFEPLGVVSVVCELLFLALSAAIQLRGRRRPEPESANMDARAA